MRKLNKDIDVLATFRTGEPPEPHKFRVRDRYENVHVLKIGQILWIFRCGETACPEDRKPQIRSIGNRKSEHPVRRSRTLENSDSPE